MIDTTSLLELWQDKERREKRRITLTEVANSTGHAHETIRNIRDGTTTRLDELVLSALCEFFGIPDGAPVPFVIYRKGERKKETKQ